MGLYFGESSNNLQQQSDLKVGRNTNNDQLGQLNTEPEKKETPGEASPFFSLVTARGKTGSIQNNLSWITSSRGIYLP